jgi:WD40 repeat protein
MVDRNAIKLKWDCREIAKMLRLGAGMKTLLGMVIFLLLTSCSSAGQVVSTGVVSNNTQTPASIVAPTKLTYTPTSTVPSIVLSGHTAPVTQLAWSPDGSLLASAANGEADFAVRLWNADGQLVQTLKGHTSTTLSLAWSPDGKLLASGSADQSVRLWSPEGELVRKIQVDRGAVWALAWSPDGSLLAIGSIVSFLNPTIQLRDPTGILIKTMTTKYSGGKFYNLVWSPDGGRLLGGATDYKLWRRDGSEVAYFSSCEFCTPSWGAAWSPDGSTFAIGDENGSLQLYDRDGHPGVRHQSNFDVNSIAWSPDGSLLAAGRDVWRSDGTHLTGINGSVTSVAWSADGQYLAVAAGKLITLVRADGLHIVELKDHTATVNRVAWSPTQAVLASASDDETIRLWRLPLAH